MPLRQVIDRAGPRLVDIGEHTGDLDFATQRAMPGDDDPGIETAQSLQRCDQIRDVRIADERVPLYKEQVARQEHPGIWQPDHRRTRRVPAQVYYLDPRIADHQVTAIRQNLGGQGYAQAIDLFPHLFRPV